MSNEEQKPLDERVEDQMKAALDDMDRAAAGARRQGGRDRRRRGEPEHRPTTSKGTVVRVAGNDVFVELGPRSQGLIAVSEFEQPPAEGDVLDFLVRGEAVDGLVALGLPKREAAVDWDQIQVGSLVEIPVTGQNTGGLELKLGPLHAFMPASHVALERVDDLAQFIGRKMTCKVLEVDRRRRKVLVSRRALLDEERAQMRGDYVSTISIGDVLDGRVKRFESFGAFVELKPGVEGLLHVSNISRSRVNDPKDVLQEGQTVRVQVLDIKEGGRRIGLGMKQLEANPWDEVARRLPPGQILAGEVTRLATFGAFVKLEDHVEGLVHISQLSPERVRSVSEAVRTGDVIQVRVLSVDPDQERISLSRLDKKGRLIGSVDDADDEDDRSGGSEGIDLVRDAREVRGTGTNLGDLLRRALGD